MVDKFLMSNDSTRSVCNQLLVDDTVLNLEDVSSKLLHIARNSSTHGLKFRIVLRGMVETCFNKLLKLDTSNISFFFSTLFPSSSNFQFAIDTMYRNVGTILNNIILIKDQNFSTIQNFEPCSYYSFCIIFKSNRIGLSCNYVDLYNESPRCISLW